MEKDSTINCSFTQSNFSFCGRLETRKNLNVRWNYGVKQRIFRVYFRTVIRAGRNYLSSYDGRIYYYRGKIVGGIYDDRLLVKQVKSAISYMPTASYELPYEGAKEMLLVDEVDNKEFLTGLFDVMYDELPTPKPKKKK